MSLHKERQTFWISLICKDTQCFNEGVKVDPISRDAVKDGQASLDCEVAIYQFRTMLDELLKGCTV